MRDKLSGGARAGAVSDDDAQAMAIQILGWITGQPDLLSRFMALSGVDGGSIRQAAAEPGFLAGVTSFVMAHEPTLMSFCTENDVKVERVVACHHKIAGPDAESWL
jgi:hypothetical protein